jgi:hypothetical protein
LIDPRINPGETFVPTLLGLVAAWPHAVMWEIVLGLAAALLAPPWYLLAMAISPHNARLPVG